MLTKYAVKVAQVIKHTINVAPSHDVESVGPIGYLKSSSLNRLVSNLEAAAAFDARKDAEAFIKTLPTIASSDQDKVRYIYCIEEINEAQ